MRAVLHLISIIALFVHAGCANKFSDFISRSLGFSNDSILKITAAAIKSKENSLVDIGDMRNINAHAGDVIEFSYECNAEKIKKRHATEKGVEIFMTLIKYGMVRSKNVHSSKKKACVGGQDGKIEFELPDKVDDDYYVRFETKGKPFGKSFLTKTPDFALKKQPAVEIMRPKGNEKLANNGEIDIEFKLDLNHPLPMDSIIRVRLMKSRHFIASRRWEFKAREVFYDSKEKPLGEATLKKSLLAGDLKLLESGSYRVRVDIIKRRKNTFLQFFTPSKKLAMSEKFRIEDAKKLSASEQADFTAGSAQEEAHSAETTTVTTKQSEQIMDKTGSVALKGTTISWDGTNEVEDGPDHTGSDQNDEGAHVRTLPS